MFGHYNRGLFLDANPNFLVVRQLMKQPYTMFIIEGIESYFTCGEYTRTL